ncbi:MAG: NEAT domain-containing protein [Anaerotruncus sp.]|nr:MAG: NEAT domain-containing protein [Anaerotruncus sp.]
MFKRLSISLTAIVFALALTCSSFSAFAMGPSKDGVYEVPIEMWHAEKERTSMGDSYIVHTALLTVDGDEKTLTIVPAETTSDMQFWYYKDGSVEGDTVEVEQKNNVEIDGTEYETAFEFPIKSDNEFVGVKFAASAMPLSPSARIKIDYDSAKRIGDVKKETTTQKATTTTTATTTTAPTVTEPTTESKEETVKNKKAPIAIACGAVGVVALVLVVTAVIKKNIKK